MTELMDVCYIINDNVLYYPQDNRLICLDTEKESVNLNHPASRCFKLLLENRSKVVSKNDFLESVWRSNGAYVAENTFYQNISILRKSLRRVGLGDNVIVTIRRKGFSLSDNLKVELLPAHDIKRTVDAPLNMIVNNEGIAIQQAGFAKGDSFVPFGKKVNLEPGKGRNENFKYWILLVSAIVLFIVELISFVVRLFI
ncbi:MULTISPECIES: winged helix-turn-helix domain-containing protein [Enterobacterales]|uniref:winged helix-turn-helix domain-containing protein n=1 Tax=Enterobacterales TaxID=91347 RepID=UPI002ED90F5F